MNLKKRDVEQKKSDTKVNMIPLIRSPNRGKTHLWE